MDINNIHTGARKGTTIINRGIDVRIPSPLVFCTDYHIAHPSMVGGNCLF